MLRKNITLLSFVCMLLVLACSEYQEDGNIQVECHTIGTEYTFYDVASVIGSFSISPENVAVNDVKAFFYYSSEYSDAESILKYGIRQDAGSLSRTESTFKSVLTELTPLTNYFCVAAVEVKGNVYHGQPVAFKTTFYSLTVKTGVASRILSHSARLKGTVSCSRLQDLNGIEPGFLICESVCSLDYIKENGQYVPGIMIRPTSAGYDYFVADLRGYDLKADTKYSYVACFKVSNSEFFGEIMSFTTLKDPNLNLFDGHIVIDGDFSDWDGLYDKTSDGQYCIYEENDDDECVALPKVRLTSDQDYIYIYADIVSTYITHFDDIDEFLPGMTGMPKPLMVYLGYDDNDGGLVSSSIDNDGRSYWDYAGFDVIRSYYLCYDVKAGKGHLGWQSISYPNVSPSEWGSPFIAEEVSSLDDDIYVTGKDAVQFSGYSHCNMPLNIGLTYYPSIRMEMSIDRNKILPGGEKLTGNVKIGLCYLNECSEYHYQSFEYLCSGRIPSDRSVISLSLR